MYSRRLPCFLGNYTLKKFMDAIYNSIRSGSLGQVIRSQNCGVSQSTTSIAQQLDSVSRALCMLALIASERKHPSARRRRAHPDIPVLFSSWQLAGALEW